MLPFKIKQYYQDEPKFNGDYSRNNLPKLKDEVYLINFDEYESIGTQGIALHVKASYHVICSDSFGVEHIVKEIEQEYIDWTGEL